MKLVCVLCVLAVGFSGSLADDTVWMKLMSARLVDATGYRVTSTAADKNIPELAGELGLKVLVDLVKKAELAETLSGTGPFTVFGPTDKAFGKLPKPFVDFLLKNITVLADILKYHVVSGKVLSTDLKDNQLVDSLSEGHKIRINIYDVKGGKVITASGRPVIKADQEASNGVIHEVAGVLFPPAGTIAQAVEKCPVFSTLKEGLNAAGLLSTLDGDGPFTLFAPTNKAIERIPKKCLDQLVSNKTLLAKVLTYHAVPSCAYSAGLSNGDVVKTVQGGSVTIHKMFGRIRVNYAKVIYADASTTNGVMHAIDRVLWPKDMEDFCDDGYLDYDDDSTEDPGHTDAYTALFHMH